MSHKNRHPIIVGGLAKKLILYILLFSSLITLIGTSLQLYLDYDDDIDQIEAAMNQIEKSYQLQIVNSMWVSDLEQLRIQLQGILDLPDMQFITIIKEGETIISLGIQKGGKSLTRSYPLNYSFKGQDVELGEMNVYANLEKVYQRLLDKVFIILITQGVKTFLVSFFIVFIFYALVAKHLTKLARYTQKLTLDRLVEPISLDRKKRNNSPLDELDIVVTAINDMRLNLIRDIEEREQVEVALAQSERRFRDIARSSGDWFWEVDEEGRYVYASGDTLEFLGYSSEEIIGKTPFDFMAPDEAERVEKIFSVILDKKKSIIDLEKWNITKNGDKVCLLTNGVPIFNDQGELIGYRGVDKDITERKQVEEELQESKKLIEAVIENIPLMIFLKEATDLRFVIFNRAGEELLGYDREVLLGKNDLDLFPPEQAANFTTKDREVLVGELGILDIPEEPIMTARKGLRLLHTRKVCIRGQDGATKYLLGISEDITDRKRAEEENKKLEVKLQQAYKMDAIGTLAGGIAHDFNNLLTIIVGYAEFISQDSVDNPQVQENIKYVQSAANRATDLVQQILAFSRQSEHELIPVRLQTLVKESIKLLRSTIPTTVEIIQDIDPQCGVVNADPTQINQIVMNLCTNAVHAMNEKGILKVALEEIDLKSSALNDRPNFSPGKYVCLSVSDTGTGMDKKTTDRIFDPFFTTKDVGKGTGMGLSVVHGIVEIHGGFITVESQVGEGSTFNVFIPVTEKKEFFEVEETAPIQTGNERILIVDDEPNLVDMGKRILESLSYKVVSESNSINALEIFKSKPDQFDLIITDQSMPNMSGSELIAEVLKIRPDMPCILCTGFSSKVSEENAEELGISKYINKPYSKKVLGEAIREVLDGKL